MGHLVGVERRGDGHPLREVGALLEARGVFDNDTEVDDESDDHSSPPSKDGSTPSNPTPTPNPTP